MRAATRLKQAARTAPPSDADENNPSAIAMQIAKDENLAVTKGHSRLLLIDIDTQADLVHFHRAFSVLEGEIHIERTLWNESKNGGIHVRIELTEEMPLIERLLLQAVLGSDRIKELMSWKRQRLCDPCPTLLLDKKNVKLKKFDTIKDARVTKKKVRKT